MNDLLKYAAPDEIPMIRDDGGQWCFAQDAELVIESMQQEIERLKAELDNALHTADAQVVMRIDAISTDNELLKAENDTIKRACYGLVKGMAADDFTYNEVYKILFRVVEGFTLSN